MSELELIIVLDLDGTIIGNCCFQADLYNLQLIQKKYKIKQINSNILLKSYYNNSKLIRPYFLYFYNKLRHLYPKSYIYIYTASEKKWAYKEIEYIEKNLQIKFNRPIFTREDCIVNSNNEYKKLIKNILPKIKKHLVDKDNIQDKLLIIDNNNTFVDYSNNFILCKTYDYIYFLDLWKHINFDYYKNKDLKQYINKFITNNKICKYMYYDDISNNKKELIYKWNYKKYKKINKKNNHELNDNFFEKITNEIINNKFKKFNNDTVTYLRKILK
tara:strand:+ start:7439 stop:8257 length:819 start_codon:yes stop_codon:yes gene_type:complete